jgi:dienelactone hydrolase
MVMDEHVIVFHSALGMRPAVGRFAARLRGGGHTVHTPDVYDGQVFDDVAAGAAARDAIGVLELIKRAQAAVEDLPPGLVYVGFSMGTGAAELLAGTRPGARAAILMHGALAPVAAHRGCKWGSPALSIGH